MHNNINLTFTKDKVISPAELSEVFRLSGIKRPYQNLTRLQKMLNHADLLITAWDGKKLIGAARAVTDFSYCCYLSDLAVIEEYQKQGIGKELVLRVQQEIGEETALILLSAPPAMDYYPQIGFNKIENGFIIPRKA